MLFRSGGFATRQLYTDQDEVLLDATRPVILNGIEEVVERPDLADRAIFLTLEPIPDDKRRLEAELWTAFEADRPRILGALLDAVVTGLVRLPEIRPKRFPRMADFAIWVTACETALRHQDGTFWEAGTFMKAYAGNIDEAVETVLNANPVATAVRVFMTTQTTWTGTATDLLDLLGRIVGEKATKAKTWPADATRLGGKLRQAATFLRKVGIEINMGERKGRGRTRNITITAFSEPREGGNSASAASAASTAIDSNETAADVTDAKLHTLAGSEKAVVPRLSDRCIRELAADYLEAVVVELEETGDVDHAAFERRLRENLATAGVPPDSVEVELGRIMEVLAAR